MQRAGLDLLLRDPVTRLAGLGDVEQRRAHVVIADLDRAFPHVGHVTVRAGHTAAGVNALAPHFELRVLGLEHLGAGFLVGPVLEAGLIVVGFDLLHLQALVPRDR
jgi:hypothetical protein